MSDELKGTITAEVSMSGGLLVAKGEKGDTGPQGPKGEGYSLTETDKNDISGFVIDRLPYSLKVDSGGYIAVEYKG